MRNLSFLLIFVIFLTPISYADLFYEQITIVNDNQTNYTRMYVKTNKQLIQMTGMKRTTLIDLTQNKVFVKENGNVKVYNSVSNYLKDTSDRINRVFSLIKTFGVNIKVFSTSEKKNIMGFECVKITNNFGGYYYITLDIAKNTLNEYNSNMLKTAGIEFNIDDFLKIFGLNNMEIEPNIKKYFAFGTFVESLDIIKAPLYYEKRFTYLSKISTNELPESVFDLSNYK